MWRNWKRIRLQNGRLQVRDLSPLLDPTLTRRSQLGNSTVDSKADARSHPRSAQRVGRIAAIAVGCNPAAFGHRRFESCPAHRSPEQPGRASRLVAAPVLKTDCPRGRVGSTPTSSAARSQASAEQPGVLASLSARRSPVRVRPEARTPWCLLAGDRAFHALATRVRFPPTVLSPHRLVVRTRRSQRRGRSSTLRGGAKKGSRGGTGRRPGFKSRCPEGRVGSTPTESTRLTCRNR